MSETTVKAFYELPNGKFGIVEVDREDKSKIDRLVIMLTKLGVHRKIDREYLLHTWKQYDRTNVRKFGSKL